jgi:hypothetical protein
MRSEEACDEAGVDIIGATGIGTDDQLYLLVLEEVIRGRGARAGEKRGRSKRQYQGANVVMHHFHFGPIPT